MTRAVRYNFACSLDGFIATPSGSYTWIVDDKSIDFGGLYAQFKYFLMGRKTHEAYRAMDPAENPLRRYYGTGRVIVVSDTLDKHIETETEVIRVGELVSVVKALKEKEGDDRDIWLMGGGRLAGLMLKLGLVDVVEAAVMPVVLGEGIKMFDVLGNGGKGEGWKFKLGGMERKETGIMMVCYDVVRTDSLDEEGRGEEDK
ncbi:dihydrofolate reductase-like domain-containing protein [Triangularia setosa]|uniref:2,5-diamino-6-ribosylamino-4(3H)-pyrimidinone 5'-phosphate reductase n=1 Tax=Triangularia setosa TaxID=2587417 RepID=A0AAN6W594_9PEZI|nr:dihydrofolate reductase-like domain-containing protein [Podospora setosa]